MIKVAIPIFLDRISPRLDCARRMLILHIEKNQLVEKKELDISHWPPDEKIIHLKQMGVDQLICGGIRIGDKNGCRHFGIQVTSSFYGEVKPIIENIINGKFNMPFCRGKKRRRRRGTCIS